MVQRIVFSQCNCFLSVPSLMLLEVNITL